MKYKTLAIDDSRDLILGLAGFHAGSGDDLPDSETKFIDTQLALADPAKFLPAEYGL